MGRDQPPSERIRRDTTWTGGSISRQGAAGKGESNYIKAAAEVNKNSHYYYRLS
jgi:hypothetical protein